MAFLNAVLTAGDQFPHPSSLARKKMSGPPLLALYSNLHPLFNYIPVANHLLQTPQQLSLLEE